MSGKRDSLWGGVHLLGNYVKGTASETAIVLTLSSPAPEQSLAEKADFKNPALWVKVPHKQQVKGGYSVFTSFSNTLHHFQCS